VAGAVAPVRVILASASPRRRQLLDLIGIAHEVRPSDIDETALRGERPRQYAERLAREKVRAVAESDPHAVAIAADTIVVCGAKLLGKPSNAVDAGSMLSALSGRMHKVVTAVAVARGGRVKSAVEEVLVTFRALTDDEIDAYIATGEPMDKAGAYGIQGYGATIVKRIEGDYFAVMGLPLVKLVGLLGEIGVDYKFGTLSLRGSGKRVGP